MSLSSEFLTQESIRRHIETLVETGQTYSIYKDYVVGERFYNMAYHQWFTVMSIDTDYMIAMSDDGRKRMMNHNWPGIPDNSLTGRKDMIEFECDYRNKLFVSNGKDRLLDFEGSTWIKKPFDDIPLENISNKSALKKYLSIYESTPNCYDEVLLNDFWKISAEHHLTALYYVVPVDNLFSIISHGILCYNAAPTGHTSFANPEIQAKRHTKVINPDLPFTLHDYVPLFIAPKPPLLYIHKMDHDQECYAQILVDPKVLLQPQVMFSNMNAVSNTATFYSDFHKLHDLKWDILHAKFWKGENPQENNTNSLYRQAEAEIPLRVPVEMFIGIYVYNESICDEIQSIVNRSNTNIKVGVNKSLFFS